MSKKNDRSPMMSSSSETQEPTGRQQLIEVLGFLLARQWLKQAFISSTARDHKSQSSHEGVSTGLFAKKM